MPQDEPRCLGRKPALVFPRMRFSNRHSSCALSARGSFSPGFCMWTKRSAAAVLDSCSSLRIDEPRLSFPAAARLSAHMTRVVCAGSFSASFSSSFISLTQQRCNSLGISFTQGFLFQPSMRQNLSLGAVKKRPALCRDLNRLVVV
jgi:hypothetical protein